MWLRASNGTRGDCWTECGIMMMLEILRDTSYTDSPPLKPRIVSNQPFTSPQRFPLHDKSRLQRWVDNMKREEWTPSRHQYLCSEHFTEDCFDIRWGIRYLKNTAIPTIFPSTEDVCISLGFFPSQHPTGTVRSLTENNSFKFIKSFWYATSLFFILHSFALPVIGQQSHLTYIALQCLYFATFV